MAVAVVLAAECWDLKIYSAEPSAAGVAVEEWEAVPVVGVEG